MQQITKESFFNHLKGRAFFDDPFAVAQYVRENCPRQAEGVVKAADEVAKNCFLFNLRWDMERTHQPVVFGEKIDWLYKPGDDPEWVYAFNRMRFWICLGQAYALTKDERYAKAFVDQMLHWVETVPNTPENAKAWRSIEVGLRLEYWLKAMCYFESSPAVTDEAIAVFCRSVAEQADFIMGIWNAYNLMSNWGVLANHGLFLAGMLLPPSAKTQEYAAEATRRLTEEIKMQVYRDGTHWEQSPMYHNEVLHCYLDVVWLARRAGVELPALLLEKVEAMCRYDAYAGKPDHNEIAMGDSDEIDQRDMITRGAMLFENPWLKSRGYEKPDFDTIWDIGEEGLRRYQALEPRLPQDTDKAFTDSGNFYFRSGWEEDATFAHFHCGPLGAGHGHADKLHVDIFSRGEDLLMDAGRYSYVFGDERIRFKAAKAHNILLVDGLEIYPLKDSWECHKLTRGINQKFWANERYGYAEGAHLAYMGPDNCGVLVNRRLIYLKPDIFVIADEIYGAGRHTGNQYFHINNRGSLSGADDHYVYSGNKLRADFRFVAPNFSSNITTSRISRHYNEMEENSVIETSFVMEDFGSAFTVIGLSDEGAHTQLEVREVPVDSNFKGIRFGANQVQALDIRLGAYHYTLVVAHEEYASPTDTFLADGCTGFGSAVVFDRAAGEAEIGTVLLW